MRGSLFLFLVVLTAFPALADTPAPPVITAVSPTSGSMAGGTSVAIIGQGLGLPPNFACLLPCPTKVTFDGLQAQVREEKDTVLIVTTPPHSAGAVDITVTTGDGRSTTARNAFSYLAEPETTWERFLLPVYLHGMVAGANGSLWTTSFWIRNNAPEVVLLAPWPCDVVCLPVFPLSRALAAGESLHDLQPFFRPPTSNPSRLLFVTRAWADRISTNLRLLNAADEAFDAGTEIPVIREKDLLTSTAQLHAVPLNQRSRLMLRIYDVSNSSSRFRVRIYEQAEGTSTATPMREVELTATLDETGDFKTRAAYAAYGDFQTLLNSPIPRPPFLRVEVEPLTPGTRYWAFVSATNNVTQRVTLVTPQ